MGYCFCLHRYQDLVGTSRLVLLERLNAAVRVSGDDDGSVT